MEIDPDPATRRAVAHHLVDALMDWQARRDARALQLPTAQASVDAARELPPEQPRAVDDVLARLFDAADGGWNKRQGGDLAYVPSGGIASGAWAALLAAGIHAFTGSSFESPALIALEEGVLRWLGQVFGLPPEAEGVLLSGGSIANQTAIAAARESVAFDSARHVAYLSERAHHSLHKALHLSGVPQTCVRTLGTDVLTRFDVAALQRQLASDRADGKTPWLVIGTAGNTDCGAVDDLDMLAAVAADARCWFHVDAAYGGAFVLTERGARRLRGIGAADSITVDAHKGFSLPFGLSALLVRRPGALEHAHGGTGAYHRDVPRLPGLPHYSMRGPELTRPFRGLLLWLPLQLHGVAAFRALLDRSLDFAAESTALLRAMPGIAVIAEPDLSIVAFRAVAGDAATQVVLDAVNASGRFHISSTTLFGQVAARLAFLHPRTTLDDVHTLLDLVRDSVVRSASA